MQEEDSSPLQVSHHCGPRPRATFTLEGRVQAGPATNPTRPCLLRAKRSTRLKVKSSVFLTSGQKEGGWGTSLSVMWMSLSVKTTRGLVDQAYHQKAQT